MNNQRIIIGLTGVKQSGKDTVRDLILVNLGRVGLYVKSYAFADALKQEVCDTLGLSIEELERRKLDDPVFRRLLQWWGTEFRRKHYYDYYWIDKLGEKIKQESNHNTLPSGICVITDCRFLNEARWIRDQGNKNLIVRIRRMSAEDQSRSDKHASEQELWKIQEDCHLNNHLCLGHLRHAVYDWCINYLIPHIGVSNRQVNENEMI